MSIKKLQILTPIVTSVNEEVGDVIVNMDNLGITEELAKKSDKGHTHNYAGSDEPGGVATSAEKLTTDAGAVNNPVYFKDGVPVALPYTIDKSVPADAVFTDTTYDIGNSTTAGIAKLYDSVGPNSDGAMTQNATQSLFDGKATTSTTVNTTLLAANWVGDVAPYTYTLTVDGVTAFSNQEIIPAANITWDQLIGLQGTNMIDGGQSVNTIILKATKNKPTVDIPIRVILRGDASLKGRIISMDLDGNGAKQYRVLRCDNGIAKCLAMYNLSEKSAYNFTTDTGIFDGGTNGMLYAGGTLDTYLNTTWYNTLTNSAKAAIVPEYIVQYMYKYYEEPNTANTPTYTYQFEKDWSGVYKNYDKIDSVEIGYRNIFVPDFKDIADYFGKVCITSNELSQLFFDSDIKSHQYIWLRSVSGVVSYTCYAHTILAQVGNIYISTKDVTSLSDCSTRPVFNIDLSKILYNVVS